MNPPRVYTCSPSWTNLPIPSLWVIPVHQPRASNLDWRFISHMILYMFQCHSPKSSHPCPLPQSPKDCSIHLCLFCSLACRVIATIFLQYGGFLSEEGSVDRGPLIEESQSPEEEAGMRVIQPQSKEQWDGTTKAERAQKCPPLGLAGSMALPHTRIPNFELPERWESTLRLF